MIKTLIRKTLAAFGYELRRKRPSLELPAATLLSALYSWRARAGTTPEDDLLAFILRHYREAHAQLFQDLFVAWVYGERREGFFVEFGATDGVALSNTCWLERKLGWRGVLAEPGRGWHDALMLNRPLSRIDRRCVWRTSGERMTFNETSYRELSTLDQFSSVDGHAQARADGDRYQVETVSLHDLLRAHGAPKRIEYLSVDTEGSEFDILSAFDWEDYEIGVITVEHNHTPAREQLYRLLTARGFRRVFEGFSMWDDWYVHESIALPGQVTT